MCWQHLQKFKCIQKTSHFLFIALPSVTTSQYGKRTRGKKSQKKKKKSTECIEIKKNFSDQHIQRNINYEKL